jgi:hypothetical protein
MRTQGVRACVLAILVIVLLALPALQVSAGRTEFGLGLPLTTSFSFTSLSYAMEAYYRMTGGWLAWEIALHTNLGFSSLYVRNTLATAGALHLFVGHLTNLLPYFGSTYFNAGIGLTLGQAIVFRTALGLAFSYSSGSFYFFPELRFQLGLDP